MGWRTRRYGPLVTRSGSSFRAVGVPQFAADAPAGPDRDAQPEHEESEHDGEDDHRSDPQHPRPGDAAVLHRGASDEPVEPGRRSRSGVGDFDRSHSRSTSRAMTATISSDMPAPGPDAEPVTVPSPHEGPRGRGAAPRAASCPRRSFPHA